MEYLTKKQLEDISKQMASTSVKDTDLPETQELTNDDYVAIVQDGLNKKISANTFRDELKIGPQGESAYEAAVRHGYVGTEEEWLASLEGETGATGPQGQMGKAGLQGIQGPQGSTGLQGPKGDKGDKGDSGVDLGQVALSTSKAETTTGKALDASVAQYKIGFTDEESEIEEIPSNYYKRTEVDALIDAQRIAREQKELEQDTEIASFEDTINDVVENYKPIVINGNVTNAPDEEDLTSKGGLLKLKDRSNLNGMGYCILRRDKSFAEQVTKENTIYEIRYDFDLRESFEGLELISEFDYGGIIYYSNEEPIAIKANQAIWVPDDCVVLNEDRDTLLSVNSSYLPTADENVYIACTESKTIGYALNGIVTIPAGCILKFVGGSISNGTVELNNCYIDGDAHFENVTFSGSIKNGLFNVLWIDASDLGAAINIAGQYFRNLYLPAGDYEFSTPISISAARIVKFYGSLTYTGAASNLGAAITFTRLNRADVYLYRLTSDTTIDYTDTRTIHFIGINFVNAVMSRIEFRDVQKFNELVRFSGIDAGCGYNTIYLGLLWYYNFALRIYQQGTGWCNSNKVIGFRCATNTGITTQHFCAIGGPALDLDSYRDQAATTTYDAFSDWSFTDGCFEGVPYPFYSRTITGCRVAACREEGCTGLFKVMYNASIINLHYTYSYKNILEGSDVSVAQEFNCRYSTFFRESFHIKIGRLWNHTTDTITINSGVKLTGITSTSLTTKLGSLTQGNVGAMFEISGKFMTVFLKQAVEKPLVVAFYDAEFNNVTNLVEAAYTNNLFGMSINAARNCYAVSTRSNRVHNIPALFKASAYGAKYLFVGIQASNTEQDTEFIVDYNQPPIVDVLPIRGDTASRPENGLPTGQSYYDTSLAPPRPIWWNGTKWIDAAGASV